VKLKFDLNTKHNLGFSCEFNFRPQFEQVPNS
jgi:hypothetical protein